MKKNTLIACTTIAAAGAYTIVGAIAAGKYYLMSPSFKAVAVDHHRYCLAITSVYIAPDLYCFCKKDFLMNC